MKYVLSIDQSTSGTKGMIFSEDGRLICRADLPHRQITNEQGWVEHDPEEIYSNTLKVARLALEKSNLPANSIVAAGISNQRETVLAWDAQTGRPLYHAIVWQCSRATELTDELSQYAPLVLEKTGMGLSPFFSGPKLAWLVRNVEQVRESLSRGTLRCGTIDSWLIYCLTGGKSFKTDYSNASRTQLLDIQAQTWSSEMLALFGLTRDCLPEICMSDSCFGYSDFGGIFPRPLPIRGVLGDSHAALFAGGGVSAGRAKVTFGTGSSVMLNVGCSLKRPIPGVVASLAWGLEGKVEYVLEGNINYTGAVLKWLADDINLIQNSAESEQIAQTIPDTGGVYLVPAFTGLGAPYFNNSARALLYGMNAATKKAHIVRAALECIAYQIKDVVSVMDQSYGSAISQISADGGPTKNKLLMQFVSDMLGIPLAVSQTEELSGAGAAYAAAISVGIASRSSILEACKKDTVHPQMPSETRRQLYQGWQKAVGLIAHSSR